MNKERNHRIKKPAKELFPCAKKEKTMKEIKFKNFRCVECSKNCDYRVYFTFNGEERWIGYYNGWLDEDSDQKNEERLVGFARNYDEVLFKWKISSTIRIYRVNVYEAYRMDEQGIRFLRSCPKDTIDYKHESLESKMLRLPSWKDGEIVTEDEETFSFVSSEGVMSYKWSEIKDEDQ